MDDNLWHADREEMKLLQGMFIGFLGFGVEFFRVDAVRNQPKIFDSTAIQAFSFSVGKAYFSTFLTLISGCSDRCRGRIPFFVSPGVYAASSFENQRTGLDQYSGDLRRNGYLRIVARACSISLAAL
jgi:hypothetical protein